MSLRKSIRFSQSLRNVIPGREPLPETYSADDLDAARREGYQRGYEEAARMLERQLLEQREDVLHLQDKTFETLKRGHDGLLTEVQRSVPELVLLSLRRILPGIDLDADAISRIVEDILQGLAPGTETVEVVLSPRDLELLAEAGGPLRERYPGLRMKADDTLRPGDCIVRSAFGMIDGRLTTKLAVMEEMLR